MGNSLGTASLQLTANNSQLTNTLGKTETDVKGWSTRVGSVLKAGLKGAVVGGFAAVAAKGATSLIGLVSEPFDRLKDISKQGDIASAFGLTVEGFTGIAGVAKSAGSDVRDFTEGLATLSGKAMDATNGKGEETQAIFLKLGINAQAFSKLNVEEQFYGLFEALNQVENPATRVNLL